MTLSEFVKFTFQPKNGMCFRPRIVCNDCFSMSVQGSYGHYCTPRVTQDYYSEMEIGFPSEVEDLILKFAEDNSWPTGTVYPCVPVDIIQQVIDKHGGINEEQTFSKL